ncbi:MAG TPA: translocation/assembly module TamB domain-containing protein, partial [Sphingomonas sp.]
DAVPERNRLDLDARLEAPVGGVVSTMGNLRQPLSVVVDGRGAWERWRGKAVARLGGGELANLDLAATDGRFRVTGRTRPGLYLAGPVERLTQPFMTVEADATLQERRVDTRFKLRSDALFVDGGGLVDMATSRFRNFALDARLLTPGAIAPNLSGRDVLARVVLDGAFATPTVNYKVTAARLAFGDTGVDRLYAEGLARVDADRILVPVRARAGRVTGLNAAAGELLTNVSVDGDLAISGVNVLSDNLRIRSDRIDATAIVVANLETGRYTGALKGRVNDYRVDGIGILNVTTDAKLVTAPGGGFGITGRVVATTSRIFNEGARDFLGGNAVVRADVEYGPTGLIRFSGVRLNAPRFRVTRGSGLYDPAGRIAFEADAVSTQYGPLSARVTGSVANPVVVLRAARPGLGVGLSNVQARIVGRGGAYAVIASGGTEYGAFNADLLVRPGAQLVVDVRRLLFAGIAFTGRVAQTAAGPFAGALRFAGSGLSGDVRLANQGGYQRADVAARGFNAQIPGANDFTVGRLIANASVVAFPNAPQVIADVQIGDLRYNDFVLQAGRARVNYQGGRGTAQALLTGSSGVPFRVALNARLSPGDYLVALRGQANNVPFRTVNPARIRTVGADYVLSPTRIDFGQGSARLAGSYGRGIRAQARLDRFDLSTFNALNNLGLAGQITGSLDFAQPNSAAFPTADARVTVRNFTRSSIAAVSSPVDIVFAGRLVPNGGEARALVRTGNTVIGRMLARLQPLAPGAGSWTTRLLAAPLGGGIRYNGPSSVLFSFAGLPNQQLSGPIALAADFSGQVRRPRLNGLIRADNLTYLNETYGTRLTAMRLAGRFDNDRLQLTQVDARAGGGTVRAQGTIGLSAEAGFPIDIRAVLADAQLATGEDLSATSTGTVRITNGPNGGLIQGDLTVPRARYQIVRQGQAEVAELTGVRRRSEIREPRPTDRPARAPVGLFRLDLRVRADNRIFVSGMGLESEWQMDLRVGGTNAAPQVTGGLELVKGAYSFAGKRFEITRGLIDFRGGALTDPGINIVASTTTNGITANINVTGTGQRPQIAFTSTPTLPQDEVLSRLLFGSSPANLSALEAVQLASALNSLRGSGGGLNPIGKLRSATGFDRLRIVGADQATGRGTSLAAGKYLTDDIYVEIVTDARGFTATQIEIALTRALSLLSSTGSFGGSSASLRYSKDY